MEILEKQIVVEPAMAGTSPISISIGAMEIPIRDLLDLRPGSKVILDHPGSQALRAWIYLGLETVAKGHLVPGEQGWEFCVEEIAAESELFAA